ncbi:hypothetical protein DFH08DRAFT_795650 [Mycena albidolilacea]|uniref:Uncharacterized protein n=1 Tax=Mycena albidolilacea TaxID=1033008 RepID=A0AAD7ATZ5_9AGAR|nr:hypothetical protein DFH08DRAFT_795650 [Mycena albidolilacea]
MAHDNTERNSPNSTLNVLSLDIGKATRSRAKSEHIGGFWIEDDEGPVAPRHEGRRLATVTCNDTTSFPLHHVPLSLEHCNIQHIYATARTLKAGWHRIYLSRDNGAAGHCSLYLNPAFPGGCAYVTSTGATKGGLHYILLLAQPAVQQAQYGVTGCKHSTASPGASSLISQ